MKKKLSLVLALTLCIAIIFTCVGCTFSLWGNDDDSSGLITDEDVGESNGSGDSNSSDSGSSNSSSSSESKSLPSAENSSVKDSVVNITSVSLENGKTESALADIIENIHDSVVEINATVSGGTSAGSGVIISVTENYSYIWTCNHVVADEDTGDIASEITVILTNQEKYDAIYCGGVDDQDVAVLKVAHTENMTAARIRDLSSSPLRVGEDAIAIGNPLGSLGGTVTKGIISATARELNMDGTTMTLLQTDASINSGNSGGGLFDANGLLVGIVNAKATGISVEGLGFAIPIDTVYDLASQLTETHNDPNNAYGGLGYIPGKKMIGVLGYATYNNSQQYIFYVQSVNQYGSAGGVLQAGDQILSLNGQSISETLSLKDILSPLNIGDTADLVVIRTTGDNYFRTRTQQLTLTITIQQYVCGYARS